MGSLGSGGLPGDRLDSDRHLEEFLLAFWLSLSSVVSDPGVMDDSWIERLADRKPGGTFFGDYARLLRCLSGLLRLFSKAEESRRRNEELTRLRCVPSAVSCLSFLRHVPPGRSAGCVSR